MGGGAGMRRWMAAHSRARLAAAVVATLLLLVMLLLGTR